MLQSSRWFITVAIVVFAMGISGSANEYLYQDDDLLCGPGFTPESYQQRIRQFEWDQRTMHAENLRAAANQEAAVIRSNERRQVARRARFEKVARQRQELVAKRKAENESKKITQATP